MNPQPQPENARTDAVALALRSLAREAPIEVPLRGVSMEPLLSNDDTVIVGAARFLWPGDVVLFHNTQDQLVAHRLLGSLPTRAGWRYILRGDAAAAPDGAVHRARISGRVIAVRRRGAGAEQPVRPSLSERWRAVASLVRHGFSRL